MTQKKLARQRGKIVCVIVGVDCCVCAGNGWTPSDDRFPSDKRAACLACDGKGYLTTALSLKELNHALDAEARREEKQCLDNSCVSCGRRLKKSRRYSGGAGRVLCERCGPAEGARLIRSRGRHRREHGHG